MKMFSCSCMTGSCLLLIDIPSSEDRPPPWKCSKGEARHAVIWEEEMSPSRIMLRVGKARSYFCQKKCGGTYCYLLTTAHFPPDDELSCPYTSSCDNVWVDNNR